MTTATNTTNLSRRTLLSGAAAVATVATVAVTGPVVAIGADPIFAAIEAHKAAYEAAGPLIDAVAALEAELPWRTRKADPRLIAAEEAVDACWDAVDCAACELVNVKPTTQAGLLALLRYSIEADTDGEMWNTEYQTDDDGQIRSWHYFLIESTLLSVTAMVSA